MSELKKYIVRISYHMGRANVRIVNRELMAKHSREAAHIATSGIPLDVQRVRVYVAEVVG